MEITLLKAEVSDATELLAMQKRAFSELLERYQDFDTNPANDTLEKMEARLRQAGSDFYFICDGPQKVGGLWVVDRRGARRPKRLSPIFVLPEFQGLGIAQRAMVLCGEIYGAEDWELDTILEEPKNCYLYEKMGYRRTGKTTVVNDRLTLVTYRK